MAEECPILLKDVSRAHIFSETLENEYLRIEFYPSGIILVTGKKENKNTTSPSAYDIAMILSALKEKFYRINNIWHIPLYEDASSPTCVVIDYSDTPDEFGNSH